MWGFGLAAVGLWIGAIALQFDLKVIIVLGACFLMWVTTGTPPTG